MGTEIITALASFVAAITGLYSYYQLKTRERDKIKVSLWGEIFEISHYSTLHIVNLREHRTIISDWGFIHPTGKLYSIPQVLECEGYPGNDQTGRGSRIMERKSDYFEHGSIYGPVGEPIGAFAKTASQRFPSFEINPLFPLHKRIKYSVLVWKCFALSFLKGDLMYIDYITNNPPKSGYHFPAD